MDNSRGGRLHSEFHSSAKYLDFQATTVMIRVTLLYRRGSIIYIYIYIYINIMRGEKDATTFPDKPVS